jgi:hypothetical protein
MGNNISHNINNQILSRNKYKNKSGFLQYKPFNSYIIYLIYETKSYANRQLFQLA